MIGNETRKKDVFNSMHNSVFAYCSNGARGGTTMAFDKEIINVIDNLNCPVLISAISDSWYGLYSTVKESKLELLQSWEYGDKVIELYIGESDDRLAVLRKDDHVYCAQYINGFDACAREMGTVTPSSAYFHIIETSGSGVYVRTEIGFFMDSQSIHSIFSTPTGTIPYYSSMSDSECILALINK